MNGYTRSGHARTMYDAKQGLPLTDQSVMHFFNTILDYYIANGEMPNYREMAAMFGMASTSGVQHRLQLLADRGLLEVRPGDRGGYRIPPAHLKIEYIG